MMLTGGSLLRQNLYDREHSNQFATFLLTSRQFDLASMELERIVLMEPENLAVKKNLIYAYRMNGQHQSGIRRLTDWYPDTNPDSLLTEEWIKLLLLTHDHDQARSFLELPVTLSNDQLFYYRMSNELLAGNWNQVAALNTQAVSAGYIIPTDFINLMQMQQDQRHKSPALALALSTLVPGLGKVYTKDWKDGIISLLFVATNAWQSYRGFSKDGIGSPYGWIFGTMALGFYTSNLFGSWKSASDYNEQLNHALFHEIEHTVYSRF